MDQGPSGLILVEFIGFVTLVTTRKRFRYNSLSTFIVSKKITSSVALLNLLNI